MVLVAVLIADRLYKTVIMLLMLLACKACAPFIYERTKERVCTACKRKIDKHEHMFVDSVNRRHNLGHNPRLIQNLPTREEESRPQTLIVDRRDTARGPRREY